MWGSRVVQSPAWKLAGKRVLQNHGLSINRLVRPHPNNLVKASHPSNTCSAVRRLSSHAKDNKTVDDCAKTLSWIGDNIAIESKAAKEFARKLTPEAQKELAAMAAEAENTAPRVVPEPSTRDLRLVALNQSIPFLGFGFMDNSILIVAGDAIDTTLGVALGISTLCAAAIGNIISDVAGVMLGTVIEDFCARLGLPVPNVSAAQRQLRSVRFASQFGCAVGIVIGCIFGMFPLLFLDTNKAEKLKQEKNLENLFQDVVEEAKGLVGAEYTSLLVIVDSETSTTPSAHDGSEKFLYGKYCAGKGKPTQPVRVPLGQGIISRSAIEGKSIIVEDATTDIDFNHEFLESLDVPEVRGVVCVPVFNAEHRVVAVIEAANKLDGECFSEKDVRILQALATHITVSLQNMADEDNEARLKDTIAMIKRNRAVTTAPTNA